MLFSLWHLHSRFILTGVGTSSQRQTQIIFTSALLKGNVLHPGAISSFTYSTTRKHLLSQCMLSVDLGVS